MRPLRLPPVTPPLVVAAFLLGPPTLAAPEAELAETVESQGEVIRELREELSSVKAEQKRSEDRVRALEDRLAGEGDSGGVDRDYVDDRIEDFERAPDTRLFMSGYGSATYSDEENSPSSFDTRFNPIFHYRLLDKLHANAEFEVTLEDDNVEFGLEFGTIDYIVNDWLILTGGKFFLPFNVFGEKLHPDWVNKMASFPPIYGGHGGGLGFLPLLNDVGVKASGGTKLWDESSKVNYALYVSNGMTNPMDEHAEEDEHGDEHAEASSSELLEFSTSNFPDDNDNKAVGGRVGFLPVPNVELGVSYMNSELRRTDEFPGADLDFWGSDFWWQWRGLELRGEWAQISRDVSGEDADEWGYWAQVAYRLNHQFPETSGWRGFLGRLEPVVRFGERRGLKATEGEQLALGLNYWLFPSVPLKLTYELNEESFEESVGNRFFAQFAYGF